MILIRIKRLHWAVQCTLWHIVPFPYIEEFKISDPCEKVEVKTESQNFS